jgi:hypothetical protein
LASCLRNLSLNPFQVHNLTLKMLGPARRPEMKCKAAESRGLLRFTRWLLHRHMPSLAARVGDSHLQAQFLSAAVDAACDFEDSMAEHPRIMPFEARQQTLSHYLRYAHLFQRAGGRISPKNHLLFHSIIDSDSNPRFNMTYRDEALNGVVARIARSCHRNTFGDTVHYKFAILTEIDAPMNAHRYI